MAQIHGGIALIKQHRQYELLDLPASCGKTFGLIVNNVHGHRMHVLMPNPGLTSLTNHHATHFGLCSRISSSQGVWGE